MDESKKLYVLLNEIDRGSNVALSLFFKDIGLDRGILNELSDVKIVLGKAENLYETDAYGSYSCLEDMITIDENYLKQIQECLNNNIDSMDNIKSALETLVHEKVHALRRIHTPSNIIDMKYDFPTMVRKMRVFEDGEEANYVLPCDVLLDGSCNFKDPVSLSERRDMQIFLEEILTEALSKIIVYNYASRDNNLSLGDIITKSIPRSNSFTFTGGMIFTTLGLDTVKWFLSTRSSKEPYHDLIAEGFGKDYEDLLSILDILYSTRSNKTVKYLTEKLCNILISHKSKKR